MTANIGTATKQDATRAQLHVVFGSGGSRAILGGAGAILAFHTAGLNEWKTIGGVSGGSIPAAMLANGSSARTMVRLAIKTDFSTLLTAHTGWFRRVMALLAKYRFERTRPVRGVFGSQPLRDFMDGHMPQWPAAFWTIAAAGDGSVLFTAAGAYSYTPCSGSKLLATSPPSVGLAVAATCAVPGIVDAVQYNGEYLFDGAIREDGQCPTDVIKSHFGARPEEIVAFDVGEDSIKKSIVVRLLWNLSCGGSCGPIDGKHPDGSDGVVVIQPEPARFHALKFKLSADDKWQSVIGGYLAAVHSLQRANLIPPANEAAVATLASQLREVVSLSKKRGELAARAEALLTAMDLF